MKLYIEEWVPRWERRTGEIEVPDEIANDDDDLRDYLNESYQEFADKLAIQMEETIDSMDATQTVKFPDGRWMSW